MPPHLTLFHSVSTVARMEQPQTISESLAAVVRGELAAQRITQRMASEGAGIPLTTLHRKLSGRAPFNVVELAALAEILGVSLTEFAQRAERKGAAA